MPTRELIRAAFAHRRKTLAALAGDRRPTRRPEAPRSARAALAELGLPERVRAEQLTPADFVALSAILQRQSS